jgi:aldehyde:ferredoxin oxidoreductase
MKGCMGKVLVIDLSTGVSTIDTIDERVYELFLSGVGLGAYYLCTHIPPGADPLGPENILGFTSGILTGTGGVMAGRWMVVCKSPLTGGWGDSNCGGDLAPAIKHCGFDAIFFKGVSEKPVYAYIDNKGASLMDAGEYWGLDAIEAEKRLIEAHMTAKKPAVAVIGPAGEKLSRISGISNDLGRYAARSGVGAVMGSKRLKAIVLAGTKTIRGAKPEAIKALSAEYSGKVRRANWPDLAKGSFLPFMGKIMGGLKQSFALDGMLTTMLIKKFGTSMNNTLSITNGDAPLKNWTGSDADYSKSFYAAINPDKVLAREKSKYHCYSCVVGCGGTCDIKDLRGGVYDHTHKPEYETTMVFGGLLMNKDLDSIFFINEMLNRAGMDSISAGAVVAFAIECFQHGIIDVQDTGGIKLEWGDSEAVIALLEKMIKREGIGDILADGVVIASQKIGKGSEKFAVHAGGQELPMHDPKIDPMMGVTYSADPTPGRHTTSGNIYFSTSFLWKKVSWVSPLTIHAKKKDYQASAENAMNNVAQTCFKQLMDCAGSCYYAMLSGSQHYRIFDFLNAVTGWEKTPDEYMEIGKRVQTMRQMFNVIQGVDPRSFKMHGRAAGTPPLTTGHNQGLSLELDSMIRQYWLAWGWDGQTGIPTGETLEKLGIKSLLETEVHHG